MTTWPTAPARWGSGASGRSICWRDARGLVEAIDARLHVPKVHLPCHESDHVLNIAYNLLAGGDCLEDLELLCQDQAYLDALGARRIPGPTTEGDFCRRFGTRDVQALQDAINDTRVGVWRVYGQSDPGFFDEARIDADGSLIQKIDLADPVAATKDNTTTPTTPKTG